METRHPWQSGPTELISYALEHLHRPGEFDQRIAYLLLDTGVETLLRTFLELSDSVTKAKMTPEERRQAARGSLNEVVQGVQLAAGPRLHGIDLRDVESYHSLRDALYPQGVGIPVSAEKVRGYADLAVKLLRRLLEVDLEPQLLRPHPEVERKRREATTMAQIEQVQGEIGSLAAGVGADVRMALEAMEPAFLMPSFERGLEEWLKHLDQGDLGQRLKAFHADGGRRLPDPGLARAVSRSMPPALRQFVKRYEVEPVSLALELERAHSTTETLLVLADSALGLSPGRNAAGIYWVARLLRDEDPLADWSAQEREGQHWQEPLVVFRKRCEEALADLEGIRAALDASVQEVQGT